MAIYHEYIRDAVRRGCTWDFETNEFVSFTGKRRPVRKYGTQKYPSMTIRCKETFPVHKFIAYLVFGEEAFAPGVQVRHLDGDELNLSINNLALGTSSDNNLDKPVLDRVRAAKAARAAQNNLVNAKTTWEEVRQLREEYSALKEQYPNKLPNGAMEALTSKFKMSSTNVLDIVKHNTWKEIDDSRIRDVDKGT